MKWILKLYPPSWRARYGSELAEHLSQEPFRLRTAADLLAGAADAWFNPGNIPKTNEPQGVSLMIKAARCCSSEFSTKDSLKSAGLMIGVTLILTAAAVTLDKTIGDHYAIQALTYAAFFIALLVSSNLTYLRPYSSTARYAIIGFGSVGWYLFFLAVTWFGTRI
ncbi:MAG: hypothetical protein AAGA23_02360 [Pseudomonadota bacterium]